MTFLNARRGSLSPRRATTDPDRYGTAVLLDSPVGWWRGNGNANDSVAGGTAGTVSGAVYTTGIVPGSISTQAWDFDGVNDFVSVPNQAKLTLTDNFTIECWCVPDTIAGSGAFDVPLSKYEIGFQITSSVWQFFTNGGGTQVGNGATAAGARYHLVGTVGGGTGRFYINGTEVANAPVSAQTSTEPVRIGSWDGLADWFDGKVGEVAMYGSALSAARVLAHYNAGITP